jgi:hypothetical protein
MPMAFSETTQKQIRVPFSLISGLSNLIDISQESGCGCIAFFVVLYKTGYHGQPGTSGF